MLRESEVHFRTLADSGQMLIWTSGIDKKCDYFNQPWLAFTGRTLAQELGDGWTRVCIRMICGDVLKSIPERLTVVKNSAWITVFAVRTANTAGFRMTGRRASTARENFSVISGIVWTSPNTSRRETRYASSTKIWRGKLMNEPPS